MALGKGRKITPELEKEILAKAAEGDSSRMIAEWLLEARGVKVCHQAVNQMLRQTRQTRADVAKGVVREVLTGQVMTDLGRLAESQNRVCSLEARLHQRAHKMLDTLESFEDGDGDATAAEIKSAIMGATVSAELALKASDRVRAITDTKLHFAGADAEESGDNAPEAMRAVQDELLGRLSRLASTGEAGRNRPEPVQH
jgi:plasmid stabilization system protein ParE